MTINEIRQAVREVIAEVKKNGNGNGPARSGGKLVELKREMEGLKRMKEAMGQFNLNESGDSEFIAEYAHMQKFVNEFNKLKEAHARLSEMLENQISEVNGKIVSETQKIKEMIGLVEPQAEAKKKKPAKKKEEPKEEKEEKEPKKGK